MRKNKIWRSTYGIARFVEYCSFVFAGLVVSSLRIKSVWYFDEGSMPARAIVSVQDWAPLATPVLVLVTLIAGLVCRSVGPPRVWVAIGRTLDIFQELAFGNRDGPESHHRVTLFKVTRRPSYRLKTLLARRLVAVARSGHMTQHSSVTFLVPDNADKAEGIAGQAFCRKKPISKDDLPNVSREAEPSEQDITGYAHETFVKEEWVRREEPKGRSYLGIQLQVDGKPWGVIVLDSRSPKPFGKPAIERYNQVARIIEALLERPRK